MNEATADSVDLWTLIGCSGLMILMLALTWYSATLGNSSVTGSGFSAATILAIFVLALNGTVGALAISFLRTRDVPWIFASKRDLGHFAITVGVFLGSWYLYRVINPPRFYEVADLAPSFSGVDDPSVSVQVSVRAPLIMSIIFAVGLVSAGVHLARRQPGGFRPSYCLEVLREVWRRR